MFGPSVQASPPPPPAGYTWVPIRELSDEFDEPALDGSKWLNYQPYWSGRDSTFTPGNVYLSDGKLCLRSTADKSGSVRAACVTSRGRRAVPGCYYEASIKASQLSMTSSFWFQGHYSEVDVIEALGASSLSPWKNRLMCMNTHFFPGGWESDQDTPAAWEMPEACDAGFHTYGVWWKDNRNLTFYYNGSPVQNMTTAGNFDESMFLFFDTEVFSWEGWPTLASLQDPSRNTMYVDWVRSWRLEPQAEPAITLGTNVDQTIAPSSLWTVWWQGSNGNLGLWTMQGTNKVSHSALNPGNPGRGWRAVGAGDFNGDGNEDLLLQNADGRLQAWLMEGVNVMTVAPLNRQTAPGWKVTGVGDFNGDGHPDILWQSTDGSLAVWFMVFTNRTGFSLVGPSKINSGWSVAGTGDFNGDGQTDILWKSADGRLAVWLMNGVSLTRTVFLSPASVDRTWKVAATADLNRDGRSGIIWQNADGALAYWLMNGTLATGAGALNPPAVHPSWRIIGAQ